MNDLKEKLTEVIAEMEKGNNVPGAWGKVSGQRDE